MSTERRQVNLRRFPAELYERLKRIALSHQRPVSYEIIWALEQYADRVEEEIGISTPYPIDKE